MAFKIRAIIEVAGFPQKHVDEVMLRTIENMKKEQKIKLLSEQIAEATPIKEVFSGFMELELEIETFDKLIYFCFNYQPSSVEILDSKELKLNVEEFRSGINDLLASLNRFNILVSNLQAENIMLKEKKSE